jgi:anti-anti-sigma regulatory factor
MEILMDIETAQGSKQVVVLRPHGRIDGSNYESLVSKVNQIYAAGTRYLLLDLGDVSFLSSAGLVALHRIVLLLQGEKLSEEQSGWDALAAIDRDAANGPQPYVKLLNLQPKVSNTLQMAAMDRFFNIFTDEQTALASFS